MNRVSCFLFANAIALAMSAIAAAATVMTPADSAAAMPIGPLIDEALANNPELAAARAAAQGAQQRIAPAGALEDPMLEAGIVNAPVLSFSFRQDDMTMKMLGLSQKLPFPGKRALRTAVAAADSASIAAVVDETANRVVRDVRISYEELCYADTLQRLMSRTLDTLRDLAAISEGRFGVGEAAQSDVLQAQTRILEMRQELLRIDQERLMRQSELTRLLGRHEAGLPIVPTSAPLADFRADRETLKREAADNRPQLRALDALVQKAEREIDLAQREYYPDFEVRLGYGQRDRMPDGMSRNDMISLSVAVKLPLWRESRLAPKVAEARAMRREASAMADALRLELQSGLEQQLALEHRARESTALYRTTLLPQVHAVVQSALNAYRVGRVDFLTLLDAKMREYDAERGEAEMIASHNKAIAEIDFLTGAAASAIHGVQP